MEDEKKLPTARKKAGPCRSPTNARLLWRGVLKGFGVGEKGGKRKPEGSRTYRNQGRENEKRATKKKSSKKDPDSATKRETS